MQNYIVYKAGSADEVHECSYSLLKYLSAYNLKPPPHQTVVIYTRQPALLESYASYFHRFEFRAAEEAEGSRLVTLRNFFRLYQGNVLFMDTDTYPVSQLEHLFSDIARGMPYVLRWNPVLPSRPAGKELKTIQLDGQQISFNPRELGKWNDSVIGISSDASGWLSEVIERAEKISSQLPPGLAEKWAFHYQFGSMPLKTADHAIAQYDELREFRDLLRRFFTRYQEESVPNQVKLIQNFDAAVIQEQKKDFRKLPLYRQLLRRITGRHWSIGEYKKKI